MKTGRLYVVSVPIGNLKDITLRALDVLGDTEFIVAEDTREIGKLLKLLGIPKKKYISYRGQNHERSVKQIIDKLKAGISLAFVSDRGTPCISDPGFKLVRDLQEQGVEIITVPGPSAVIAALSISGMPTDKFTFLGFLPRSRGKQVKLLERFGKLPATFVIYESPYRIVRTLKVIEEVLGNIDVALAHELTKSHEEIIKGEIVNILKKLSDQKLKGEWVIIGRA